MLVLYLFGLCPKIHGTPALLGAACPPRIPFRLAEGDSNPGLQGCSRLHSRCSAPPKTAIAATDLHQATIYVRTHDG